MRFVTRNFLLVIDCTLGHIVYHFWDRAFDRSNIALFFYPSCV